MPDRQSVGLRGAGIKYEAINDKNNKSGHKPVERLVEK
jgi:hypothetical protein